MYKKRESIVFQVRHKGLDRFATGNTTPNVRWVPVRGKLWLSRDYAERFIKKMHNLATKEASQKPDLEIVEFILVEKIERPAWTNTSYSA